MAEHSTLTGASLHEPKGTATAPINYVYVSDGAGSGEWKRAVVDFDTATAGQRYVADGAGGGSWKDSTNIHGEMTVTNYTTTLAVPLASDTTLATDADYIQITGAMWAAGEEDGVTFTLDSLDVPITGNYSLEIWASLLVSVAATTVAIKYAVDETAPYSTRKLLTKNNGADDIVMVGGSFIVSGLTAGEAVSLYIAADKATNVTIREAGVILTLLEEV